MPFIRGRYHINPVAGAALEAAREADEALARREANEHGDGESPASASGRTPERGAEGPIHRVEIEATEVVPPHSGRAQQGFIARIHRGTEASRPAAQPYADYDFFDSGATSSAPAKSGAPGRRPAQPPETHVFAHHQDLTDFLHGEFEKDSGR